MFLSLACCAAKLKSTGYYGVMQNIFKATSELQLLKGKIL